MSKYYFDTEFFEKGGDYPIDFISIGIVDEDGREYYAVSSEFDWSTASEWLVENVQDNLGLPENEWKTRKEIAQEILEFVGEDKHPVFWSYYSSYDWVVLCQLYGTMMELPEFFPKYTRDIKQLCDELGNPNLPKQKEEEEHSALQDAHYHKKIFEWLMKYKFRGKGFNLKDYIKENEKGKEND